VVNSHVECHHSGTQMPWQHVHTEAVSQSRVHLLGSICLPSILLQKRVKNTSWHSENEVWNTLASVQVCVIWEAPHYIFRHRFGEIGPCAKHCGDFKTTESTHVQPRYFSKRSTPGSVDFQVCWRLEKYFGGTRWRRMLEIVALKQLYSRLRNTQSLCLSGNLVDEEGLSLITKHPE